MHAADIPQVMFNNFFGKNERTRREGITYWQAPNPVNVTRRRDVIGNLMRMIAFQS